MKQVKYTHLQHTSRGSTQTVNSTGNLRFSYCRPHISAACSSTGSLLSFPFTRMQRNAWPLQGFSGNQWPLNLSMSIVPRLFWNTSTWSELSSSFLPTRRVRKLTAAKTSSFMIDQFREAVTQGMKHTENSAFFQIGFIDRMWLEQKIDSILDTSIKG